MIMKTDRAMPQPVYIQTDADRTRKDRISAAWQAYRGEFAPPLVRMPAQPDDNVISNRCAPIVDTGVSFLFGDELEIALGEEEAEEKKKEGSGTGDTRTNANADKGERMRTLIEQIWGQKEQRIPLLSDLAMNGAIAGTAFLRIVPLPDGSFRLVVVDPATVSVQTAPQDCETVLCYCIEYAVDELRDLPDAGAAFARYERVFYREEITRLDPQSDDPDAASLFSDRDTRWQITHWTRTGEQGPWQSAGAPLLWPHPFPPIFACKNLPNPNDFWGKPDLTPDLIGMNKALNLVQSNINRIEKLYGAPILYANGLGEAPIDIRPGQIIALPLPESKIASVAIQSDVSSALAFCENLRSDMDEQSGVPGVATGRIKDLPRTTSGIALQMLYAPILKKTAMKRCLYGKLIIDVTRALLVMAGLLSSTQDAEHAQITLNWQNPLPIDDQALVQAAILKRQLGISQATLQRELGYDPDEEAENEEEETEPEAEPLADEASPAQESPFLGRPAPAPAPAPTMTTMR